MYKNTLIALLVYFMSQCSCLASENPHSEESLLELLALVKGTKIKQTPVCEQELVEYQLHYFNDNKADYSTTRLFLPVDFHLKSDNCGKWVSEFGDSQDVVQINKKKLIFTPRYFTTEGDVNIKLVFLSDDSGLVYSSYGRNEETIGSFSINPI